MVWSHPTPPPHTHLYFSSASVYVDFHLTCLNLLMYGLVPPPPLPSPTHTHLYFSSASVYVDFHWTCLNLLMYGLVPPPPLPPTHTPLL